MKDEQPTFSETTLGLAALRDASVALVAGLYILGFDTWSFRSWMLNLGRIAAFDPQYFVAGIPTLLLLIITLLALKGVFSLIPLWTGWFRSRTRITKVLLVAFWLMPPLLMLIAFFTEYVHVRLATIVIFGLLFALSLTMLATLVPDTPFGSRLMAGMGVIGGAGLVFIYSVSVYGSVPQELGGGAARCAQLDLKLDQVSPETATELAINLGGDLTSNVRRTKPLEIIFGADNKFIVLQGKQRGIGLDVIVLDQSAVMALKWCEPTMMEKMIKSPNPGLQRTPNGAR